MFRTGNPALGDKTFESVASYGSQDAMTIQGTVNKTFLLLFMAFITAMWAWGNPQTAVVMMLPALIIGFIVAVVTVFKKEWAGITAPLYACVEGIVLGSISVYFEMSFPGIVMQAVGLTFGTLFSLLAAYKSGLIRVSDNFRLGVVAATGGIALFYFVGMILGFFGIQVPLIYSSGIFGIGFSIFVIIIAAFNLVLDFDFIEQGSQRGAPKYMEWYGAFGLMVTLVWLYLEILRLLAKMRRR